MNNLLLKRQILTTNKHIFSLKKLLFLLTVLVICACTDDQESRVTSHLRAPAYPLINIDTYTNAWLFGDTLYQHQPSHWTGKEFPLIGALRVDGKVYRFMGIENNLMKPVLKAGVSEPWTGQYSTSRPTGNWTSPDFNSKRWTTGNAPFGMRPEHDISTPWESEYIWVRREFILEEDLVDKRVVLEYSHDDDIIVYINGFEVVAITGKCQDNATIDLTGQALHSLKKGKNVVAAYCRNITGYAYLDFGLSVEVNVEPEFTETAIQKSVEALPTQTIYTFICGPVDLELTFTAPLLMDNLELLSRPVNYLTYDIRSNDDDSHAVDFYLEAGTSWALNIFNQKSVSETFETNELLYLKTGSKRQHILGRRGDDVRIDWGHFYLSSESEHTHSAIGEGNTLRRDFIEHGVVKKDNPGSPDGQDRLAFSRSLGKIKRSTQGYFMLGYNDLYSIQYFGENLRPYWNRKGDKDIFSQFEAARKEYKELKKECDRFDAHLMKEAQRSGGAEYAELCALAYRQSVSAHKLVEAPNGDLLFLSKENYSSGSIATVDVSYPSAPLFLLYNVELMKGMLNPIFYYVESGKWGRPFAPHDIGIYPIANGQVTDTYLPVEESGNMLILATAIATMEGNARYAEKHWNTLSLWADFLVRKGFDPDYQDNTDVFAGRSAHNANLSIKAILGIASYGRLADMLGKNDIAQHYTAMARKMALDWVKKADDGDHYRFAFDQPGTWSQKYNLVWDKIMKINVFPHEVREKEFAYYLSRQDKYGLPLDSRHQYTKADWIVWSATLARSTEDFQQLIVPLYKFVNETTDRIPMSDWYWTDKPEHVAFRARSVLGGYYIKMMEDKLISQPN